MSNLLSFVLLAACIFLLFAHFTDIKNANKKNGQ